MSRKGPFIVFRVIGFLLLVALIVGGGGIVYKAGVTQGISQAPAVATAISQAAENGQAIPPMAYGPYGYGHPYSFGYLHFGFFPFSVVCGSIIFLFVFFGVLRMVFFCTWRNVSGHHGPWGRHWEGGIPPMFNEWHKQAHEEKPAPDTDKSANDRDEKD
mgnify:CR=1 FL=1